jgi:fatty acid desaturase
MADRITEADAPRLPERVEWPTLAVAAAVYGGFGLATWFHEALPWWLLLPLGGFLVAWHGSLQHEAVHGHPTPWNWVNEALVFPSLWLWLPFRLYRISHLTHHNDEILTDPARDPESFYVAAEDWDRLGPLGRAYFWSVNTLAGRLLVEPLRCVWRVLASEAPRLARGDIANLTAWLLHLAGAALVLAWALGVCAMPLLDYLLFFAYPGLSLTLLRSFLEHQARPAEGERSVLVEAGWPLSLLFLNNNLHALHHAEPGLAWFKLPERYRARRAELLERNGGYRYGGYLEIAARYLVKPKEHPRHPLAAATRGAQAAPETAPAG